LNKDYCQRQHPGRFIFRCIKLLATANVRHALASCLIYAWALLEYVISEYVIIMWLRSVIKMLWSVKFAEDGVLTFLILSEKC